MEEEYPVKQMLIDIFSGLAINFISFFLILPSLGLAGKSQRIIMTLIYAVWMLIRLVKLIVNYKQNPDKIRMIIGLFTVISLGFYAVIFALTLI